MMDELEKSRHAAQRGDILRTLKEDYTSTMTSLRSLLYALDLQGSSLSADGLGFHLTYLEGQGYVQLWRYRDMPHFRKDRPVTGAVKVDTIMFAKLLPKGLQLLDGLIPEDPSVVF
jgi:hypothetical protein